MLRRQALGGHRAQSRPEESSAGPDVYTPGLSLLLRPKCPEEAYSLRPTGRLWEWGQLSPEHRFLCVMGVNCTAFSVSLLRISLRHYNMLITISKLELL